MIAINNISEAGQISTLSFASLDNPLAIELLFARVALRHKIAVAYLHQVVS